MPTLLQVSLEVNVGSVGRIAEQIGQEAIKAGWKSYITYARKHLPSESETIKIGSMVDVYMHGLRTRLFDQHCLGSKKATLCLIQEIERIKPDIIQLHHLHGYYIHLPVFLEYLSTLKTPIFWTQHDCWNVTGHCAYFDYVNCMKWKSGCYECPQISSYPASLFVDRSKKNFEMKKSLFEKLNNLTIVSVSHWLADVMRESILGKFPQVVIHNGIDLQVFAPEPDLAREIRGRHRVGDRKMLLGIASTWEPRKGLRDFCELSKLLPKEKFLIVLVGLSKNQIKQLPEGMVGITRTENVKELAGYYSAADLFLNLTYEDSFPTVNLEALACGTPVLTYDSGGSPEAVTERCGYVVPKGDLGAILQHLFQFLKFEEGLFRQLSSSSRERVEKLFCRTDCFEKYIKLFASSI